ncbi:MAG TPA: hypothetical protein VLZ53_07675, partial [Devosia sp.]|nr:hypothetical protein [Devosia sp.]
AGALTGVFQIGGGFVGSTIASVAFEKASTALLVLIPVMAALTIVVALVQRISAPRPLMPQPPET